jgi:hypothetical protein
MLSNFSQISQWLSIRAVIFGQGSFDVGILPALDPEMTKAISE